MRIGSKDEAVVIALDDSGSLQVQSILWMASKANGAIPLRSYASNWYSKIKARVTTSIIRGEGTISRILQSNIH